jgi:hypothetical protein
MEYKTYENSVDWDYFDRFEWLIGKYMPPRGEGENRASQIATAVNKLIYKWYNDGDVFDNTHTLKGWCNDLSSYANWLDTNTGSGYILDRIEYCYTYGDYEQLLKELADELIDEDYLAVMEKKDKIGSIYDCDGKFKFVEEESDEDRDYGWW